MSIWHDKERCTAKQFTPDMTESVRCQKREGHEGAHEHRGKNRYASWWEPFQPQTLKRWREERV